MANHSSILAWRIPGTGEPGGLPSMGSHRVGHYWSDLAAAAAGFKLRSDIHCDALSYIPQLPQEYFRKTKSNPPNVTLNMHLIVHKIIDFTIYRCPWTPREKTHRFSREEIKNRDSPLSLTKEVKLTQSTEGRANFWELSEEGLRNYGSSLPVASRYNCFCCLLKSVFIRIRKKWNEVYTVLTKIFEKTSLK